MCRDGKFQCGDYGSEPVSIFKFRRLWMGTQCQRWLRKILRGVGSTSSISSRFAHRRFKSLVLAFEPREET